VILKGQIRPMVFSDLRAGSGLPLEKPPPGYRQDAHFSYEPNCFGALVIFRMRNVAHKIVPSRRIIMSPTTHRSKHGGRRWVRFLIVLLAVCAFLPPRNASAQSTLPVSRTKLESSIKTGMDPLVRREPKLYWRDHPVKVTEKDWQTLHVRLNLAWKVNNWFDPDVNVDLDLSATCNNGKVAMAASNIKLDIDTSLLENVLSSVLLQVPVPVPELIAEIIEQTMRQAIPSVSLPALTLPTCPTIVVDSTGDIVLGMPIQGVLVCADSNWRNCSLIDRDWQNLEYFTRQKLNDKISSVRLIGVKGVTLYVDKGMGGRSLYLTHNCPDLKRHNDHGFGDKLSSLKISR
jgi:hypothetical protein